MGTKNKRRFFALCLVAILLLQTAFGSYHVFSSHVSDHQHHIEINDGDVQWHEAQFHCHICNKLLGNAYFLLPYLVVLLLWVQSSFINKIPGDSFIPIANPQYLLRGPPRL